MAARPFVAVMASEKRVGNDDPVPASELMKTRSLWFSRTADKLSRAAVSGKGEVS